MTKDKLRKVRVHFVFAGGIMLVLGFGVLSRMTAGERFFLALWNTVTDGRPVEWLMIVLFWYAFGFHKPRNDWTTGQVTSLGLSGGD